MPKPWLALTALALAGCGGGGPPLYSPPQPAEAQAVVEVRTRYAAIPWLKLVEWIELDGARIKGQTPTAGGYTRRVHVRPGLVNWKVDSSLYWSRMETQMRRITTAGACGPNGMVCASTTLVPVEVQVNDPVAVCRASLSHRIVAGEQYLLEFDLVGHGQCHMTCSRLTGDGSGAAKEPCPQEAPAPPKMASAVKEHGE